MAAVSMPPTRALPLHTETSDDNFEEDLVMPDADDETLRRALDSRRVNHVTNTAAGSPVVSIAQNAQAGHVHDRHIKAKDSEEQPRKDFFVRPASKGEPLSQGFQYAVAEKPKGDYIGANRKGPVGLLRKSDITEQALEVKVNKPNTHSKQLEDAKAHAAQTQSKHAPTKPSDTTNKPASATQPSPSIGTKVPLKPPGASTDEADKDLDVSSTEVQAGTEEDHENSDLDRNSAQAESTVNHNARAAGEADTNRSHEAPTLQETETQPIRPDVPNPVPEAQAETREDEDSGIEDESCSTTHSPSAYVESPNAAEGTTLVQDDTLDNLPGQVEPVERPEPRASARPSPVARQNARSILPAPQPPSESSLLHKVAQTHGPSRIAKTSKRNRIDANGTKPRSKTTSLLCALMQSFEADAKERDYHEEVVQNQEKALAEKAELIDYYEEQLEYAFKRMQALNMQRDEIEQLKLQQQETQRKFHEQEATNGELIKQIGSHKQSEHASAKELNRLNTALEKSRASGDKARRAHDLLTADVQHKEQELKLRHDITHKLSKDLEEAKGVAQGQWKDLLSSTESKIEGEIRRMQEAINQQPRIDPGKFDRLVEVVQQIAARPSDLGPGLERIDMVAGSVTTLGESLCKRFDALEQKQDALITSDVVETILTTALADLKSDMKSCEDLSQQLAQTHGENERLRQGSEIQSHHASQLQARQDELQAALDSMRAKLASVERDLHHAEAQVAEAKPMKDKIYTLDTELTSLRTAREFLQSKIDEQQAQEATRTGEIKILHDSNHELKLKMQRQQDDAKLQHEILARQSDESARKAQSDQQQAQKLLNEHREEKHQQELDQKIEQVKALADCVGALQRELDCSRKDLSTNVVEQAAVLDARHRELNQTVKRAEAGERAQQEAVKAFELSVSMQEKAKQELVDQIAALKKEKEELDAQGKTRLGEEQRRADQLEATIQLQREELEKSQRQVQQQLKEIQAGAGARSMDASDSLPGQPLAKYSVTNTHNDASRVKQSEAQKATDEDNSRRANVARHAGHNVDHSDATEAKPRRKANRSVSAAISNARRQISYTEVEDSQLTQNGSQLSRASTLPSRGNTQESMLLNERERASNATDGHGDLHVPETQLHGPRSLTEITESMSPLYHRSLRSASRDLRSASTDLIDADEMVNVVETGDSRDQHILPKTPVAPNSSSKVSQPHCLSRNTSRNSQHVSSATARQSLDGPPATQQNNMGHSIAWGSRKANTLPTESVSVTVETAPSQGFRVPSVPASMLKRKSGSDKTTDSNKRSKPTLGGNMSDPLQPSASHHFAPKKTARSVTQHRQPPAPATKRPQIGDAGVSPMKMARKQSTGMLKSVSNRRTKVPLPTRDDMEQLFQTTIHENQPRQR